MPPQVNRTHRRAAILAAALAVALSACGGGAASPTGRAAAPAPAAAAPTTAPLPVSLLATTEPWKLPEPVSRPVVLPDGSDFLVLGGLATGDVSTSRIVQVDPSNGAASLAGRLEMAVHDSAGAQLGGGWFVFGGGSYSSVGVVQEWTAGSATEVGQLPQARSDLSATVAGGTAYLTGGYDGTSFTPDVLATTDGTTFRVVSQLAVPVRYGALAALGGDLWVVGGVVATSEGGTTETDVIQKVDLATGQTEVVGHLPEAMGHATAVVLDRQLFVLGGRSGATPSATIWRIDTATGAAVQAGQLPQALSDAGSVVVGGVAYLVGGEVSGPTAPLDAVVALRPAP